MEIFRFLKIIVFVVFVVFIAGCSSSAPITKSNWFAVKNASVDGVGKESITYGEEISFLKPHRILNGSDILLAFRESTSYSNADLDAGHFLKATVTIPKSKFNVGEVIYFPTEGVTYSFVEGGSAWPRRSCFAKAVTGTIKIINITNSGVSISVDINSEQTGMWPDQCKLKKIQWSGELSFRKIESLTTFEGKAGAHIYSETYDH